MFRKPLHYVLADKREELDVTQDVLAERAGISGSRYPKLERGEMGPTGDEIETLARVLGIDTREVPHLATRPPDAIGELLSNANPPARSPIFFPPQDRPNYKRYRAARKRYPDLVRAMTERLRRRPDFRTVEFFCECLASGSGDECLYLISLLLEGALPGLKVPVLVDFIEHPIIDPESRKFVGNRYLPCLVMGSTLYFVQVSLSTPATLSVDFLVWDGSWRVIEIDGAGHDRRDDSSREASLAMPVMRVSELELVNRCRRLLNWPEIQSF